MEHICPSCQHVNPARARFCARCGAQLERTCRRCGSQNSPGSAFCIECGQRLAQPAETPSSVPTTPPVLAASSEQVVSYTPPHLVEKILTSRSALEGERKQVTVLFADLKGSVELLADRDPEGGPAAP